MKIDAVGVTSRNLDKTIAFYSILGFQFDTTDRNPSHIEPKTPEGSARLMIDKTDVVKDIIGEDPKPGNHSSFAINLESPDKVDTIAEQLSTSGFTVVKKPWDAFWGQRYCVIEDPDGYRIDLYAALDPTS